jgi:hypothetical protein
MLYRMTEWQSPTGQWHCNCVDNLAKDSGHWIHPARILGMSPANYVEWTITNYHPIIWYNEDCSLVFFSWDKQSDMRKYKNYINVVAKKINYQI